MSKNQIDNQLNKLFDNIKEKEKAIKQPLHAPKFGVTQKLPQLDVALSSEQHRKTTPDSLDIQVDITDTYATMSLPLRMDTDRWGTLQIVDDSPKREWDTEEQMLVQQVTEQLSLALENARLFEETERRREELALVNKIVTQVSSTLEMQDDFQYIAKEIAKISDALHVGITLLDEEKKNLILTADFPPTPEDLGMKLPLENNPSSIKVIESQKPLSILDVQNNPLTASIKDIMKERKTKSLVIFPLIAGNETIGTLGVDFGSPTKTLTENQTDLIQTILLQISTSIETSRLFDKTQSSEAEFRSLFAAMEDVIFIVDKDTRYLRIAPTKTDGLYRLPENLIGKRMDEIMPKETAAFFQEAIQKALASDETITIEYPLEIGEKEIWFDASLSKLDENQVYWVARDITERKEAEKELESAHARVQFILDSASVPMHITSAADGTFLYANQAVSNTLRLPLDEILGTSVDRFYYSDKELEEFNDLVQKQGGFINIENRYIRGNGEMFWGLSSTQSFEYKGQDAWLSTVIDITDIKNTEATLQRQNEYMEAAAEVGRLVTSTLDTSILFRRAVNLLQDHFGYYHAAIFTTEEAGAGLEVIVREATGKAGEEMKKNKHALKIGSKSVVGTATDRDREGKPYIVNDVSKDPNHHVNPLLPETKAEAAIPLKIGRRIIGALDLQATEVDAFTPEDIAVLEVLADQFSTAIDNARSYKLAQDAFFEMKELEKLKSQFLANMSHELRTPLNSIIGFSRVILKGIDGPITDLQEQDLTAIYNSGQHLLGLINDILDLSKIEAGKMELTFDEVDIEKLIKSVMSTVMGLVKDKPVRLKDEIEANLPPVKADPMRLRQILINFFSNAAKFTDEGIIKVTAIAEGSFVRIGVKDSGPGISEKDQEKLFQAFSQVDASATRATGGSGLGLSISKELVTMHGGEIGLNSEINKGSEFYFTLPFFKAQQKIVESEKTEKIDDTPTILAIDDDEKVIDLYKRYLNSQGYQVVALTDPQKAVARAKELKPYAITLDIMMPNYDGWQVLEDLKSDPETQHYPTIICSIVEDTKKGYSLGATDYLLKPILDNDLLSALNRINDDGNIYDILLIDDDYDDLRLLEKLLAESKTYKPILANSGPAGWDAITANTPQAVILDLFMPEMNGFEIMESMQESPHLREIPVIVISGGDLSTTQQEKLNSLNLHLLQKGSLNADDLLATLERSLNHLKQAKGNK